MPVNPEVVRRWVNEVQTALHSENISVQYHALALLHQIKRQDRLAVSKVLPPAARRAHAAPPPAPPPGPPPPPAPCRPLRRSSRR